MYAEANLTVTLEDKSINAAFGKTYSDATEGKWVAMVNDDIGGVKVAINTGNAAKSLGVSAGAEVEPAKA